ncbi:hypothetical protein GCM10022221_58630 [Actinocorallia aurea]
MKSSELVSRVELDVQADHGMFGIGDGWDEDGSTPVPGAGLLGVGEGRFLLHVAEDGPAVKVGLELWKGALPPCEAGYDVQETVELRCPTGRIDLDQITLGGDAGVLTVPAGVYSVRVTGWGRARARTAFAEAWKRYPEDEDAFDAARSALHGTERYLIQFLRVRKTARIKRSGGCYVPEGSDRIALVDSGGAGQAVFPAEIPQAAAHPLGLMAAVDPGRRAVLTYALWNGPAPLPPSLSPIADGLALTVSESLGRKKGHLHVYGLRPGQTTYRDIPSGMAEFPAGRYTVRLSRAEGDEKVTYQADLWKEEG